MQSHTTRADLPARILAVVVFLLGIGLLCLVFSLAYALLRAPVAHLELPVTAAAPPPPAANIGIALTAFVRQLLLLALMTLAGSLIAGKGIHLYFSALHGTTADHAPSASPSLGTAEAPTPPSSGTPPP